MEVKFGKLGPALTVYFFHFYIHNYFRSIILNGTARLPGLYDMIDDFVMHDKVDTIIPSFDRVPALMVLKEKNEGGPLPTGFKTGGSSCNSKKKEVNLVHNTNVDQHFVADTMFGKAV